MQKLVKSGIYCHNVFMITQKELTKYLNQLLYITDYQDYGPNGLQIEGTNNIKKIAFAVSATADSINQAVKLQADALIVHHGLFWKFHGPKTITKSFYKRVAPLIKNDINLYGYHLPLDGHIELGNAASIAHKIGLEKLQPFGDHKGMPTGVKGSFAKNISPKELKQILKKTLDHEIIHNNLATEIKNLGIITGGANSNWKDCLAHNLDAYLTGEISEHDWHESQEAEIHFFAGGHNATEQFGVQSLLEHLHTRFQANELDFFFIPSANPA